MIKAALEGSHSRLRHASAFRKNDERFATLQHRDELMHRIIGAGDFLAFDQYAVKNMVGEIKAKPSVLPIVTGGHRPSFTSGVGGQDRPENEKVEVARVIGKVDALCGIGRASQPPSLNTGEEPNAGSK